MVLLQPIKQHRAVDLSEHVGPDLDDSVGADAKDVRVERRVMDLAHRQAVGDDRLASLVAIGENVSCIEQRRVTQGAHGASSLVGP